jgi:hypothetical protein
MAALDARGAEILLIHDGELADVRQQLEQLRVEFQEGSPSEVAIGTYLGASLVISTPSYLLDRLRDGDVGEASRIAIMSGESRSLRSLLARGRVEWIVRRPVHPAALRLLIVHCIYRGPEKRKNKRVSVGAEVQIQTGWRRRDAILAEISQLDCRILSTHSVERGGTLKLRLPAGMVGPKAELLRGRVVRAGRSLDPKRPAEINLVFEPVLAKDAAMLRDLVAAYSTGPAVLQAADARAEARRNAAAPPPNSKRSLISVGADASDSCESASASPQPERVEERRDDARHAFNRRVIAIGQEATRILVGRDISRRGMRVDPSPALVLGAKLQIAIHQSGREAPLVIDVEVARDDGEQGVLLNFIDLTRTAEHELDDVIHELGSISAGGNPDVASGESPRLVSEILELGGD